jgi:diguanylate cyclase (GGDEF)-like protein
MTSPVRRLLQHVLQASRGLDLALYVLGTYVLPVVIVLISVMALFVWDTEYTGDGGKPLEIRVAAGANDALEPAQGLALLEKQPYSAFADTKLLEEPFWLSFEIFNSNKDLAQAVEFPSRHALDINCWDAKTLEPLGSGNRHGAFGAISATKAGFSLALARNLTSQQIVCRSSSVGPARISARLWPVADLDASSRQFHRNSGLLDGGIIILAVFVLVTALINRSGMYVLFAGWLVANLRMAALSAGWDTQWLGHSVPYEWLIQSRLVTTALYYTLTAVLFSCLFREDLQRVGYRGLLAAAQWSCVPLVVLSFFLPFASFLPIIWVSTGIAIPVVVFLLIRILMKTRSRVAMWYSASIGVTLFASLSEVVAAALGIKGLVGTVNSVTAALSSSLLAALAIAEQMRQDHRKWLEAKAELEHTFEAMPVGMFTLDVHGRFMSANPALLKMLGRDVLEDGGHSWRDYFEPGAWTLLHHQLHNHPGGELEINGKALPGVLAPNRYLVKATLARDKIEGSLQDVTEKSRATEELNFLANNDPLTKVLNRRGIEKVLANAIDGLSDGRPLALAYLDLDRFKLINDLYGHVAGDEVLQQVCSRINNMLSGDLHIGRVGGDEFVIVLPDTKISLATLICQGIVTSLGNVPYKVGDRAFHVRGSVGLIEVSAGMALKDAISTADRACRDAKAGQGNGLVVYERFAVALQRHEAELRLVAQLSTSSATDGLYLEMQPIMSLTAPHESLNFEVLLRMRDPSGKIVPTDRIIAAGENSGRMGMIDRWVLSTTLAWLNANYDKIKHTKFVCMNLSGASLNDEKFLQDVYAMLELNTHIANQLCLEITESVALHDLNNTRRFVDRVRGYGAKVALDDFGAGYTSFSYLKDLTADLLKIDGSFIVNMNNHPANIAIVEAIVSLARNLGMKTIAEWAEDNATVQTLAEIGVDYVQGYAVARPQAPAKLLAADSSASFIQDEQLALYAFMIGKADKMLAQVDLFAEPGAKAVH